MLHGGAVEFCRLDARLTVSNGVRYLTRIQNVLEARHLIVDL